MTFLKEVVEVTTLDEGFLFFCFYPEKAVITH